MNTEKFLLELEESTDITNRPPEEIFEILDFMSNKVQEFDIESRTYQKVSWGMKYQATIHPSIHNTFIKGLQGNMLIFGGYRSPDGEAEVEIKVPYNGKYPNGFKVELLIGEFWK